MDWCNAYTAYKKEYNQWLCMKVGRNTDRCYTENYCYLHILLAAHKSL